MRAPLLVALVALLASPLAALPTWQKPEDLDEETFLRFTARIEEVHQRTRALKELARTAGGGRLDEDAVLTTPQLISKYGYPSESHEIVTEDGYILTFHRIPHGRYSESKVPNSRPLYLQHGLTSASDDWIVTGPEKGFGYILADAGYDVWIGNSRGNKWSRQHVSLNPEKSRFWDFSWHEMGVYDVPAAIDYILETTGQEQLHYVGHSMGTTMFAVMGAERPEYNAKIRAAALLAPSAFFEYKEDPVFDVLAKYGHQIDILARLLGINEVSTHQDIYTSLGDTYCHDDDPTQERCLEIAELFGVNREQFNATLLPVIMAHFPSGAAIKNLFHYVQSYKTGDFRQYDHGTLLNMIKYGTRIPPKYDVTKVTAPVALHYAENDGTVTTEDAQTLAGLLPNLIGFNKVPNEKFNHLDFVFAIQAKELVYDLIISQLNQF